MKIDYVQIRGIIFAFPTNETQVKRDDIPGPVRAENYRERTKLRPLEQRGGYYAVARRIGRVGC